MNATTTTLTTQAAEKLVDSIGIPPRPEVVRVILEEKSKHEHNLKRVVEAISGDAGVSAALLKTLNSPLYGIRSRIQSIPHAVTLLGLGRVSTLVSSLALRTTLKAPGIERFWDQSARTALVSAWLASKMRHDRDSAHMFGLFRDVGIPLLLKRFEKYKETLRLAEIDPRGFTAVEDERHGMNHAVVGTIMARNWHLPEVIREAIQRHHDPDLFLDGANGDIKNLVAISHLAAQLESRHSRSQDDSEWPRFSSVVKTWLMMSDDDIDELLQDAGPLLLDSGF